MGKVIKIRRGVFETNSSSTHSITMCTNEEYQKFLKGELYISECNDKLLSLEQIKEDFEQANKEWKENHENDLYENIEQYMDCECIKSYVDWEEDDCLESYISNYTTPNGEEIIAFGKYGYDG